MLFLLGGSYAFTDQFVMSASTLVPLTSDQPFTLMLTGKAQLVRSGRVRIAAHGMLWHVGAEGGGGSFDGFSVGSAGGALTYCLDAPCHSYVNAYAGAGFSSETDNSSVPIVVSASLVQRLGKRVKLAIEADSGLIVGEIDDVGEGVLATYGLRFTSRNIGVDIGFVKMLCDGCDTDVFPMGFPWLSFTYRGGL
jgi:hypothetical protein